MLSHKDKKRRFSKRGRLVITPRNVSTAPEECTTSKPKAPSRASSTQTELNPHSGLKLTRCGSLPAVMETPSFLKARPIQTFEAEKAIVPREEKTRLSLKKWKTRRSPIEEQRAFKAIECFRHAVRRVRTIVRVGKAFNSESAMFFGEGICKMMEEFMSTNERSGENEEHEPTIQKPLLSFDPKVFKANKEVKISKEVETILGLRPEERTADQLRTVMYALQTLSSFAELPLHMQETVCKVAWLQSIPRHKIIIKKGHLPEHFYFIISGSVTVMSENDPTTDSLYTSLGTLRRGSSFGERAFLSDSCRTATVISKDPVQLLVIDKEDYLTVFMGRTKHGEEAAHIRFCRSVEVFADWPVDLLVNNNSDCMFQYFRRGTVIVRDSNESDWLYVIVSGVCDVLMRLDTVKPRLRGKNLEGKSNTRVEQLSGLTENRHRKSKYGMYRRYSADLTDACSRMDLDERRPRRQTLPPVFPVTPERRVFRPNPTTFVQIDVLHPRDVFGLASISSDYDSSAVYPASVSLVSRGAECVMVSKKLFTTHASDLTEKWIRHNVRPYPSRRTLQKNLQDKVNWVAYRHDVVQSVVLGRSDKKSRLWKNY